MADFGTGPAMTTDITMTLLEDLRGAIQSTVDNALPMLEAKVHMVTSPLGLFISVKNGSPYPDFVLGHVVLRPTAGSPSRVS